MSPYWTSFCMPWKPTIFFVQSFCLCKTFTQTYHPDNNLHKTKTVLHLRLMFGLGIWKCHHQSIVFTYFQPFFLNHVKCHFYFLYDVIHFLKFPSTLNLLQWFCNDWILCLDTFNRLVNYKIKHSQEAHSSWFS